MKWSELMNPEIFQLGKDLAERALNERNSGIVICPPQDQIFRALELTSPDKVKVCIIGQDPYHTPGQANGLAFSITNGRPLQPSLRNIFKELCDDFGCDKPTTSDLTPWAKQGVLLLNTTLTVEAGLANSHANWGWKTFTSEVFRVCSELPQPIVFIAWGKDAQNIIFKFFPETTGWEKLMNEKKKVCLFSSHPSPFSASRATKTAPAFFGSKPFSLANKYLERMGENGIDWRLL